jgi:hypothetical protein
MTHPKTINKAALWRLTSLGALIIVLLFVSACDRVGRAPGDLDVTPTALPPTPTPTPVPEVEIAVSEEQLILDVILAVFPDTLPSGQVIWQRDNDRGIETVPRVEYGFKIFYTERGGGQAEITVAVFNTPEEATAHFEFIGGLRDVLETLGTPNDLFPSPNLFGSGTYGSDAILVVNEVYFIEISIPRFSSTVGNPLVALSRSTIGIVDSGLSRYNTVDVKPERLDAILAVIPDEISAGETVWQRRVSRDPEVIDDIDDGVAVSVLYNDENSSAATLTFYIFDTPEIMAEYYDGQRRLERSKEVRLNLRSGAEQENMPTPNLLIGAVVQGEAAIIQVGEFYMIDIELFSPVSGELLAAFAEEAVSVLEEAIALYDSGVD